MEPFFLLQFTTAYIEIIQIKCIVSSFQMGSSERCLLSEQLKINLILFLALIL